MFDNIKFQAIVNHLMKSGKYNKLEAQQIAHDIIVGQETFARFQEERKAKADHEIALAAQQLGWA